MTQLVSSSIQTLIMPLQQPLFLVRLSLLNQTNLIRQFPSWKHQALKLKEENDSLKVELESLKKLQAELQITNLNKSYKKVKPVRLVSLQNKALLTSSDLTGIIPGQPLVSKLSLLGIVEAVTPPVVKVIPLNLDGLKLDVKLSSGPQGRYTYTNNMPLLIDISSKETILPGDTLFTKASVNIPENLIIGQVVDVLSQSSDPLQKASVKLSQDLNTANDLFIITEP
ncbi:hypothetical protein HY333_00890 [Candidatus Collierbacteria bacterium]|nr:hypothetical protein [Candidatus Collierbacteria bacterium]